MAREQKNATVLIIDDNPMNVDMLDTILRVQGYATKTVLRSQEALDITRELQPDIILLDITMPVMDGFQVCRALKADEDTKDIPVIFISALSATDDKVKAFEAGGVDYITKPFQMEEVVARVDNHLTISRQNAELEQRYTEIQGLQGILRSFLSQSAWESMNVDFGSSDITYTPHYETMTIMMSDVAGFTKLTEQLEPNDLVASLSLYMSMCTRIIYQFNGEVDKYLGDGIFAFFRSASDAVQASLRIQGRLETFNKQQEARGLIPMPTRIGLATGKVLLALIGTTMRREYSLLGDRVNTAARLQSVGKVGLVAIDEATYQAANQPEFVSQHEFSLKNKEAEERVYFLQPKIRTDNPSLLKFD